MCSNGKDGLLAALKLKVQTLLEETISRLFLSTLHGYRFLLSIHLQTRCASLSVGCMLPKNLFGSVWTWNLLLSYKKKRGIYIHSVPVYAIRTYGRTNLMIFSIIIDASTYLIFILCYNPLIWFSEINILYCGMFK